MRHPDLIPGCGSAKAHDLGGPGCRSTVERSSDRQGAWRLRSDRGRDDVQTGRGSLERVACNGRIGGGIDMPTLCSQSDTHWRGQRIVRVVLVAHRGCWMPVPRSGSVRCADNRLGTSSGCGSDRSSPLDGVEGAPSPRAVAAPPVPREAADRYEWSCPGDLLHIDVKTYPRFDRPGHAGHRRFAHGRTGEAQAPAPGLRPRSHR
jgi:hypothetical protein